MIKRVHSIAYLLDAIVIGKGGPFPGSLAQPRLIYICSIYIKHRSRNWIPCEISVTFDWN
jgi:hypothetical protein